MRGSWEVWGSPRGCGGALGVCGARGGSLSPVWGPPRAGAVPREAAAGAGGPCEGLRVVGSESSV